MKNQAKMNELELKLGVAGDLKKSWHWKYRDSAWIFIGGLPYDLTEGDVIAVFSQYGEIVNLNLIRDHKTGKSKGFGFLCYEDQRSTILAVDNFNGIKSRTCCSNGDDGLQLLNRYIRVDHVEEYRVPKDHEDVDDETRRLWMEGCAPKPITPPPDDEEESDLVRPKKLKKEKKKKSKKEKKAKKEKKKKKRRRSSSSSSSDSQSEEKKRSKLIPERDIKTEPETPRPSREEEKPASFGGSGVHWDFLNKKLREERAKIIEKERVEAGYQAARKEGEPPPKKNPDAEAFVPKRFR